ncbi:c-type cytochrome [Nitrospirota bacterium]
MKRFIINLITVVMLSLITVTISFAFEAAAPSEVNPFDGDPKAIAAGKVLYEKLCTECHNDSVKGKAGVDLMNNDWSYGGTDADLFESVALGRFYSMPPFINVHIYTDDVWRIVSYIRSAQRK